MQFAKARTHSGPFLFPCDLGGKVFGTLIDFAPLLCENPRERPLCGIIGEGGGSSQSFPSGDL
jgi:hypothetical protein